MVFKIENLVVSGFRRLRQNHFSRMFPAPLATAIPEPSLIVKEIPENFVASIKFGHHEKCFIISSKMLVKEVVNYALTNFEGYHEMMDEEFYEYIAKSGVRKLSMDHEIGFYIHTIFAHGSRIRIEVKETAFDINETVIE